MGINQVPTELDTSFLRTFCQIECWQPIYAQHIVLEGYEEVLWSVSISISPALRVAFRAAALDFGMGDVRFKSTVM